MLYNTTIPELAERMDATTLRVHAPSMILLVCGGKIDVKAAKPPSLREAVSRMLNDEPFNKFFMLLAEHLEAFFPRGSYRDVLTFENDLAQIAHIVLLISESYGSVAELGAFVMVEEIAKRTLVVIDDQNYGDESYIKLGPLRFLETEYGPQAVCVVHRDELKIPNIRNVADVDVVVLRDRIGAAIKARTPSAKDPSKFDASRPGHVVKLAVGIIQHYGALTITEVQLHLDALGVPINENRLDELLLCAEFANWIDRQKQGIETYFITRGGNEAISYRTRPGLEVIDKNRWRADIAAHWKASDPGRFHTIQKALAK